MHKIEVKVIKSHSEQVLTDLPCFWMLWELLSLWPVLKIMKTSQVMKLTYPKRIFTSVYLFLICCWHRRCSYFKSCYPLLAGDRSTLSLPPHLSGRSDNSGKGKSFNKLLCFKEVQIFPCANTQAYFHNYNKCEHILLAGLCGCRLREGVLNWAREESGALFMENREKYSA